MRFGRDRVAIATRHRKALAIRPAFARLGLAVQTVRCDTDALGTFSGERERAGTPLQCALEKCRLAHAATGERYCLGSEGSFGPHPQLPFLASDHEIICFTDFSRGYSVHEQTVAFETNFSADEITSAQALQDFATRAQFPAHALVLRGASPQSPCVKGIRSWRVLHEAFAAVRAASPGGQVRVETDMRAHVNPTRMRVIAGLAGKLALRLRQCCPACGAPGFGLIDAQPGLPCSWCGRATRLFQREIHGCAACGDRRDRPRQDALSAADPAHCDYCNP